MGREAICRLTWGKEIASCRVLLEASQLIVRGEMRHRLPIAALRDVAAHDGLLTFRVGQENVALSLGSDVASKWAKAMAARQPTLAGKLGITAASHVVVIGVLPDVELAAAIAVGQPGKGGKADLIVVSVETRAALDAATAGLTAAPVWVVYPKGAGQELDEAAVRETLRGRGYVDTKVASVSENRSAILFQRRAVRKVPVRKRSPETRSLRALAGIGPSLEANLRSLGVHTIPQLAEHEGLALYQALCKQTGTRQDPCVLDVFRCAVAQARDRDLPVEQRNWWWWSRARKAGELE